MGWAKSARSDRERGIFMQMAATWLHAAALAQAESFTIPVNGNSLRSRKAPSRTISAASRCRRFRRGGLGIRVSFRSRRNFSIRI